MHEYPVTVRLVEIAEDAARQHGGRVRGIDLVVGEDSGFVGESIQMYFDVVAEGTLCEGATLRIHGVRAKLRCEQCGAYFLRRPFSFTCPACGGEGRPSEVGKEFYVQSVDIEMPDEVPQDAMQAGGASGTASGAVVTSPEGGGGAEREGGGRECT